MSNHSRRECKRELAVRIVTELNRLGPAIGSSQSDSANPLAELMGFYWFEDFTSVYNVINGSRNPGWLGYIHYNHQQFVALADFLYPEGKGQ